MLSFVAKLPGGFLRKGAGSSGVFGFGTTNQPSRMGVPSNGEHHHGEQCCDFVKGSIRLWRILLFLIGHAARHVTLVVLLHIWGKTDRALGPCRFAFQLVVCALLLL